MSGSPAYSRRPAHQNTFAFKHNPNSRKTKTILALPNTGLCARCHDLIEWKKKYRKYKPLDRPRKCTGCAAPAIKLAYHVLCQPSAGARGVCAKCLEARALVGTEDAERAELRAQIDLLETHKGAIPGVPERERRALVRRIRRELGEEFCPAIVIARHEVDRHRQRRQERAQDGVLLRQPAVGEVARRDHEVGFAR